MSRVVAVIAARNEEEHLPDTLRSLKAQTHAIHKIIVINDGSTDKTVHIALLNGCAIVNLPHHEESYLSLPELPAIWNKGFERAERYNPNFILISGADQTYPSNYIEKLLSVMRGNVAITSGEIAGHGRNEIPRGSGRLVNVRVWKNISDMRFVVSPGWESHMINSFAANGHPSKVVRDLVSIGRPLTNGPRKALQNGRGMRAVGYHWYRATMRSFLLSLKNPRLGITMLWGYCTFRGSYLDCADYVRTTQRKSIGRRFRSES